MLNWILYLLWFFAGLVLGYIYREFHNRQTMRRIRKADTEKHQDHLITGELSHLCDHCDSIKAGITKEFLEEYLELVRKRREEIYERMQKVAEAFGAVSNEMFSKAMTTDFSEETPTLPVGTEVEVELEHPDGSRSTVKGEVSTPEEGNFYVDFPALVKKAGKDPENVDKALEEGITVSNNLNRIPDLGDDFLKEFQVKFHTEDE